MPLLKQGYQNFKASCNQFLTVIEPPLQVSENDQNTILNSVKTLVTSERFSFVVDLSTFEITHCLGVERWLGSDTKPLSMFDYLTIIHPNYVDQRIIACLPIREKKGRYWWVKRDLNRQLAAILTYPQALSNRNKGGIVVIQFSLFDSNSIGNG